MSALECPHLHNNTLGERLGSDGSKPGGGGVGNGECVGEWGVCRGVGGRGSV